MVLDLQIDPSDHTNKETQARVEGNPGQPLNSSGNGCGACAGKSFGMNAVTCTAFKG
jgi:hypothetical protein